MELLCNFDNVAPGLGKWGYATVLFNGVGPSIVAGQRQRALAVVRFSPILPEVLSQVFDAPADILREVIGIGYPQSLGCTGH